MSFRFRGAVGNGHLGDRQQIARGFRGNAAQGQSRAGSDRRPIRPAAHDGKPADRILPLEWLDNKYIHRSRAAVPGILGHRCRPTAPGLFFLNYSNSFHSILVARPVCAVGAVGPDERQFELLFAEAFGEVFASRSR